MGVRREAITQTTQPMREAYKAYLQSDEYRDYLREREKARARAAQRAGQARTDLFAESIRGASRAGHSFKTITEEFNRYMAKARAASKKGMTTLAAQARFRPSVTSEGPGAVTRNLIKASIAARRKAPAEFRHGGGRGWGGRGPAIPHQQMARARTPEYVRGILTGATPKPAGLWEQSRPTHRQRMDRQTWMQMRRAGETGARGPDIGYRLRTRRFHKQLPTRERLARIRAQAPGYINPMRERLGLMTPGIGGRII